MNVIITLAGKSSRFLQAGYKTPKYLLPIRGGTILEDVVASYPEDADFFFGISEEQSRTQWLKPFLESLASSVTVYVTPNHDLGPTYTALMAPVKLVEEPTVVAYCDFLVRWNFETLLNLLMDADMVVPTFSGFHPAHMSQTKYAYCRVSGNNLVELREKTDFPETANKTASVGAYFFRNMGTFVRFADMQIAGQVSVSGEFYVSLISNLVLSSNGVVKVHDVERFICLGTPEDYEEYLFWSEFHSGKGLESEDGEDLNVTDISLVTMAGAGTRYSKEGVRTPKPMVLMGGKPLFLHSAEGLPPGAPLYFVALSEHVRKYPIEISIRSQFPNSHVVELPTQVNGQGISLLRALEGISDSTRLVVSSADYLQEIDWKGMERKVSADGPDFIVFTTSFQDWMSPSPADYEFCIVGEDGELSSIPPKGALMDSIGRNFLVTGTFWFRNAGLLRNALRMAEDESTGAEVGIGHAINELLRQGCVGQTYAVASWIDMGRPQYLERFQYWKEFFFDREQAS